MVRNLAEVFQFQFTHPGKGATPTLYIYLVGKYVSIHAPWEGCDRRAVVSPLCRNAFQFTHPGKGATASSQERGSWAQGFNSRTLGRVRLTKGGALNKVYKEFQFMHPGKGATDQ